MGISSNAKLLHWIKIPYAQCNKTRPVIKACKRIAAKLKNTIGPQRSVTVTPGQHKWP